MDILSVLFTCSAALGCHSRRSQLQTQVERWPQDSVERLGHVPLIVVGDSIMYNWGVLGGIPGTNHAIGGQKLISVAEYFAIDVLEYHPDAVLIEGGLNDLHPQKNTLGHDDGVLDRAMSGEEAVESIISSRYRLLNIARQNGIKVYFASLTPFDNTQDACSSFYGGAPVVERINAALRSMCDQDDNCTYVDFFSALGGNQWRPELHDGCIHLNSAGYALMNSEFDRVRSSVQPRRINVFTRGFNN